MSEYNNQEGWEPSSKTREYWRFIPMKESKEQGFVMPPLFKEVNPVIKWYLFGFFGIIALEGYATFAVAIAEGVPIEIISLLVFVDVFLAILPHLCDGKITDLKNFIFIGQFNEEYLKLDPDEEAKYKASYIDNVDKLKRYNIWRIILYIPIIFSTFVKLYLFFSQYPFYDTYQAYIVFLSYSFGCILHILCTGYVIMYWRFKWKLRTDRKEYGSSAGKLNKAFERPEKVINSQPNLVFNITEKTRKYKIKKKDSKFYIHYNGLLIDEEISDLVEDQDNLKEKMPIALTCKMIQTSLLRGSGK